MSDDSGSINQSLGRLEGSLSQLNHSLTNKFGDIDKRLEEFNNRQVEIRKSILERHDLLGERITSIDVTLARNTVSLEEHMKRSDLLEKALDKVKENDIEPIQRHIAGLKGAMKFGTVLGSVLTFLIGIVFELIKYFHK